MSNVNGDVSTLEKESNQPPSRLNGNSAQVAEPPEQSSGGSASWRGFRSGLPQSWSYSAPWRQEVQRRRITLIDELARLELQGAQQEERAYLINDLLEDANMASREKVTPRKWWWGTEIERAWARLREVEEQTVHLLPDPELPACAANAARHGNSYLDANDQRLQHLQALRAQQDPPASTDELRSSIIRVQRAAHDKEDQANREARYLRNRLLIASAFSVLFAVAIVSAQSWLERVSFVDTAYKWDGVWVVIPRCRHGLRRCGGDVHGDPGDIEDPVELRTVQPSATARVAQDRIRTPCRRSRHRPIEHRVDSKSCRKPCRQLLLMAVLFGAGQHAVTRYVDQRAEQILTAGAPAKSNPKKDDG